MMLIPLCYLLSHALAEWVEIAQNNYRRNTLRKDVEADFATDSLRDYPNLTMRAPDRPKGLVNKVNHVGHVRRVPPAAMMAPTRKYPDKPAYRPTHETAYTDANTEGASNKQEYYDIDIGDSLKVTKLTHNLNGLSSVPVNEEDIYTDRIERFYSTTEPTSSTEQSHRPNFYLTSESGVHSNHLNTQPSTSSMMVLNINESDSKINNKFDHTNLKTMKPEHINQKTVSKEPMLSSSVENYPNVNKPNDESLNNRTADLNTPKGDENTPRTPELLPSLDIQNPEKTRLKLETSEKEHFDGMWRMLIFIKDIITKNTQRGVKSKIKYLKDLKNNILYSIEEHINRAWPDDPEPAGPARSRRARSPHARGHVELPSSEGALMTISFLTFAVFLIKLVLQIIHAYKNKTMMMTPAMVTAVGRAVAGSGTRN